VRPVWHSAARSLPDVVSVYQEWLSGEMSARSEDARRSLKEPRKRSSDSMTDTSR